MEDPVLSWFDCSLCPHSFHIAASHSEAVEAHHRRRIHGGDVRAVLVPRSWSEEPEGGYTVSPPVKEDWICRLIWTIGDMAGLPAGTRMATNDDKLLTYKDGYWMDRTGQLYSPLVYWLPVVILPPRVE